MRSLFVAWFVTLSFLLASASAREWTDKTGKFSVEADLAQVKDGKVILKKADGKTITVPLNRLSAADRRYLATLNSPQNKPRDRGPENVELHPTPVAEGGLQKKISLSYELPFGVFGPDDIEPLIVTLELTGADAETAIAYGFLRVKPVRDNKGAILKPVKSRFSFNDPSKEFVDLDAFSKEEGTLKIHVMLHPPSKSATHLALVEGSLRLKTANKAVNVPFKFKNVALGGGGGETKLQSPGNHGGFFSFAFSPDEKHVAGGTGTIHDGQSGKLLGGGEVLIWDAGTGRLLKTIGQHRESVQWLAYSHEGSILASASEKNGEVKIWSMPNGRPKQTWKAPIEAGEWESLILAPDGKTIVAAVDLPTKDGESSAYEVAVWDTSSGKVKWKLPVSNSSAVALSLDGETVAGHVVKVVDSKVTSNNLLLCNVQTGEVIRTIDVGKDNPRDGLCFLPDGKTLAGLAYRSIVLWNTGSGERIRAVPLDSNESYGQVAIAEDGKTIVLPRFMGDMLEVWDLETGNQKGKLSFEFPKTVRNQAFSSDLTRMACDQQGPVVLDITNLQPATSTRAAARSDPASTTQGARRSDRTPPAGTPANQGDLEGNWSLVYLEQDGRRTSSRLPTIATFTGEEFVVMSGGNVVVAGTFKLDSSVTPKRSETIYTKGPDRGKTIKGIYQIEGDTFKFCRATSPDDEWPTQFNAKRGSALQLSVYKRAKKLSPRTKPPTAVNTVNLMLAAKHSSSSYTDDHSTADMAFDNDETTFWASKIGNTNGAWIAARWDQSVTVKQLVLHEYRDRVIDFDIQRFDGKKNTWIDLMHVFGNRHYSSYSQVGAEKGWGYRPDTVWVDGKRLEDQKDRQFGTPDNQVNPVFTIHLPDPLTTTGIRLLVKRSNRQRVAFFEIEAY